ncbi:MAG: translocation/assembly module TamB [Deltaproteobacteria bacterium]|nr:translocation/assembly module TamB [Deltaproteobacteria bacterium]
MTWWRKLLRWLAVIGLVLALIAGTAVFLARHFFEGEGFGTWVADSLNAKIRGRIAIGSIEWPASEIPTLATGGWVPVTMRGVDIWDSKAPDARHLLHANVITGEIDAHALFFRSTFAFRHVVVNGGELLLQQVDEPYPLHAYDKSVVSLLAAFYPIRKPAFGNGITVSESSIFDIRDFEIRDVDVTMLMGNYPAPTPRDVDHDGKPDPYAYTFRADLQRVTARGFLYMDASDSLVPKFYFALSDPLATPWARLRAKAPGGKPRPGLIASSATLRIFDGDYDPSYIIPLDRFQLDRLAQLPRKWPRDSLANSLEIAATAHTPEGADISLRGDIQDYWDRPFDGTWALAADAKNLGRTLHNDFSLVFREDAADVTGHFELRGPYLALPKISFALKNLKVDLPIGVKPLPLAIDSIEGVMDNVNEQMTIEKTVARGAGGEVEMAGTMQLSPLQLQGSMVVTKPLDLGPYLPDTVRQTIGDRLSGRVYVTGDIAEVLQFKDLQLALGRARFTRGAITAEHYFDKINFAGVRVDADATTATVDGLVNTSKEIDGTALDLRVTADSPDLAHWLTRLGVPAVARSGGGSITIKSDGKAPVVAGRVHARGVPVIDDLAADLALTGDAIAIASMSSHTLGALQGSGKVLLDGTPRLDGFRLSGAHLDAARLGTGGLVSGSINAIELRASGPLEASRIRLTGSIDADGLSIAGEPWGHVAMCINDDQRTHRDVCRRAQPSAPPADDPYGAQRREVAQACAATQSRGGLCVTGHADRAAGGAIDLTTVIGGGDALRGAIDVTDLPFAAFLRDRSQAGGQATSHLFLGGTTRLPTVEGAVHLARTWVLSAFLGDADITAVPAGPGEVAFSGSVLQGRVNLRATVGTAPPYPATFTIDLRRVDLDPFVDIAKLAGLAQPVRAWASGQITVTTQLGPTSGPPPLDAVVALSELAITLEGTDPDGRPSPLTVTATSPVRLRYHDGGVELACVDSQPGAAAHVTPCAATLATPAGAITVTGSASPDRLAFRAKGTLDMSLLRPLLSAYVEESGGTADLDVTIGGTPRKPIVDATLALNDVWFRPPRQDTIVRMPGGKIGLKANNDLGFTGTTLQVTDTYSGEVSTLELRGTIKLADFKPVTWGLQLDGELPAKLLVALAPESFSQASGVATIGLALRGAGSSPPIDGSLTFDDHRPFTLVPRGVHRELIFNTGSVNLVDHLDGDISGDPCDPPAGDESTQVGSRRRYRVDLCDVGGSIDDEGRLRGIRGTLEIADGALTGGDVTLRAEALPFRIPHVLDLVVNADSPDQPLHLASDELTGTWTLTGAVEVVSGSYTQGLDLGELVIRPTQAKSAPSKPFWEEYPAIGATALDLSLDVRRFAVDNNLATVDMAGQLTISGTPRDPRLEGVIQVGRGNFRLPGSRAQFTDTTGSVAFSKQSPASVPSLAITSEARYRDPSGQDHLITLTIEGPLSQLNWNLSTSSGLNKGQTITLIFSGRTPEQFRRQLGNDTVAGDPSHIDPTTNPNDSYADQIIKDVAADFISLLVEDSLKDVSKLDVARLEIGTGSIGFHAEKKLLDNLTLFGDIEQTIRGRTIYVRGEYKTPVKLILQGGWLNKSFDDAAEEDISDPEVKLVYRLFIP